MRSIRDVMKGNLLVFTLGDVLRQLSMFITFPFFSLYVQALGGSIVDIGIVNSLRALSGLLIYPIAGYVSDRYSRIKVIVATVYFVSPIWLLYAFAWDWRALAVANFVQGLMTFYFPHNSITVSLRNSFLEDLEERRCDGCKPGYCQDS